MGYGERIRQGRKRLGLTQRQLARRLGATDGYISHLEKGLRLPSWEFAVGLARVLELPEEETRGFLNEIDAARMERARRRSSNRARAIGATGRSPDSDVGVPTLRLLDLDDGGEVPISLDSSVRCLAIAADGGLAGGTDDGAVLLWDDAGELRHRLPGHTGPVLAIASSPDGMTVASGGEDGVLKIWKGGEGADRCTVLGESSVTALTFSRDGRVVAAGYRDGMVRSWKVASGEELRSLATHAGPVGVLAFSPDGAVLASGNGGVTLWTREGEAVRVLRGLPPRIRALAFSHDGQRLAAGSGEEGRVQVWAVPEGEESYELPISGTGVVAFGFSEDDTALVTVSRDGRVESWSTTSGRRVRAREVGLDAVDLAALAADGSSLLVFGRGISGAEELEQSATSVAAELQADPGLRAAYRDLVAAYSNPDLRQAVVVALRSFAQAAGAPDASGSRRAESRLDSLGPSPDHG